MSKNLTDSYQIELDTVINYFDSIPEYVEVVKKYMKRISIA